MFGLGTIVNVLAILVGGSLGLLFRGGLKEHYQNAIIRVLGLSTIFIGAAGALPGMLRTENGALTGLRLHNDATGEESAIEVDGAFLAVGLMPENEPFAQLAKLNDWGYFDSGEDCCTATPGLFVAGDCRSKRIRQVVTAAGDGAIAAMAACRYLD